VSQADWIILMLKIGIICGFVSLGSWIYVYGKLVRWHFDPIGWTLVIETALLCGLLLTTGLSLFLHFNRTTSLIAGWIDFALIAANTPVMTWRSLVWIRESRKRR
jgi:hypothetical protein